MQSALKESGHMFVALLLILALALPAPVAAKEKEYLDGKILDAKKTGKHVCYDSPEQHGHKASHCDIYTFILQIEDMTYQAEYDQHSSFSLKGAMNYKFKEEDWPVNGDVEVRLQVRHLLGLRRTFLHLKRSNGKELEVVVKSKQGPDGKELCGNFRC